MRKFYIFAVFLTALAVLLTLLPPASALDAPYLTAKSSLLVEVETGQVLYETNMKDKVSPGGITKVMTVLVALRAIENGSVSLEDTVTVLQSALGAESQTDAAHIKEGETMRLRDLLYCAYIASSGDACGVIAEYIAGSAGAFVALMNKEAARLNCSGTHFTNTDGALDQDQYTTAWDQHLILREAVTHTLFLQIAGTLNYKTVSSSVAPYRVLSNSNRMLYGSSEVFSKYCVAGMADDTPDGGSSLVSCIKSGNRTLICVIFGAAGAAQDEKLQQKRSYYEAKSLFDWGLTSFTWHTFINEEEIIARVKVALASGNDYVELRPQESIILLTRADLTDAEVWREFILYGMADGKTLTAPLKAGDILGEISVTVGGIVQGRTNLVAARGIKLDTVEYMKLRVSSTLSNFWVRCGAGAFAAHSCRLFYADYQERNNPAKKAAGA